MWKIRAEETSVSLSVTIDAALLLVDRHGGSLLFTHGSDHPDGLFILGINPVVEMTERGVRTGVSWCDGDLFETIRSLREANRQSLPADLPLLFGMVGYDAMDRFEEPGIFPDLRQGVFPDMWFTLCEHVFVWRASEKASLKHFKLSLPFQYHSVHGDDLLRGLQNPCAATEMYGKTTFASTSFSKNRYVAAVNEVIEHIRAGDCYQANISRQINAVTDADPVSIASALCHSNQIAFGVVSKIEGKWLCSTSPERFFRVENGAILTSPIKGTAPCSIDPSEDAMLVARLVADVKENSELSMITDLLRNDLSRICEPGSVVVGAFPRVMSLSNVHHLYADVSGALKTDDLEDILKALFPGGSITGCPRISACGIIADIEGAGRGPYTGTFGYVTAGGTMDFNILIRTVFQNGRDLWFNVGGGITVLSDPGAEWFETVHKASSIVAALRIEGSPL